jgi:hypothetical protein
MTETPLTGRTIPNRKVLLGLYGRGYPLVFARVTDETELDRASAAA